MGEGGGGAEAPPTPFPWIRLCVGKVFSKPQMFDAGRVYHGSVVYDNISCAVISASYYNYYQYLPKRSRISVISYSV